MKKAILLLIALLLIALGFTGVLWPEGLMPLLLYSFTGSGVWVAAVVRVFMGALLIVAASAAATPRTVRVIGITIILAGVLVLLLTLNRPIDWWTALGPDTIRMMACLPLAVGIFLGGVTVFRKL